MHETIKWLTGDFSVLDLGCANGLDLEGLGMLRKAITLIEIDVGSPSKRNNEYYKKLFINKPISGRNETRVFYPNSFSFLKTNHQLVKDYGIEGAFLQNTSILVECETIKSVLNKVDIRRVDFLKTDLEGLDFEILSSAPEIVSCALVVQSELRFQPFFIGEPPFHQVASFLYNLGFELINMRPEEWKYQTPNRQLHRDGRLVFADAIFFLAPEKVRIIFGKEAPAAFVKQIILAKMLGLLNYGEYLYEQIKFELPATIQCELEAWLRPKFGLKLILNWVALRINSIPYAPRLLQLVRGFIGMVLQATKIYREEHIGSI